MDIKKVVVLNLESVSAWSHLGMCCFLHQVFGSVSQSLLFLCGCYTCYKCAHRLLLNLEFQCVVVFAEAALLSQVVASAEVTVSKMLSRNTYWSQITLRERSQTCRGSGCCPDAADESALYRDKFTIINK